MFACVYVCLHVCACACVCVRVRVRVCVRVRVYVCVRGREREREVRKMERLCTYTKQLQLRKHNMDRETNCYYHKAVQ